MKLIWVNHASFIVEHLGTRLICDPWLKGSAFDDGWDLLAKTSVSAADLASVTHIWYSHEHPDHFAPRVLKEIPAERRQHIVVLYQQTRDGRVLQFCREQGYRTRALPPGESVRLGEDFQVTCGVVPFYDSWLAIEAGNKRLLNINDCVVDQEALAREIKRKVGPVDVLFTQFNWAEWMGNADQAQRRRQCAAEKRRRLKLQIEVLRPAFTVPFASYFYFSHADNFHQNSDMNRIEEIASLIERDTESQPVILYPGDEWNLDAPWDNGPSVARYSEDVANLAPCHVAGPSIALEQLTALAEQYCLRLGKQNSRLFIWLASGRLGVLPSVRMYLWDLEQGVVFDWRQGLRSDSFAEPEADVALHSSSLAFVLRFDWGMDTLTVNGRFRAHQAGYRRFVKAFSLGSLNNVGRKLGPQLLADPAFVKRALGVGKSKVRIS